MIDWSAVPRETYERMAKVVIKRLHPTVQSIDGSGGDMGIDLRLDSDGGVEIWQIKSFTGRLGSSQRKQVVRSLESAASHEPAAWHLVVPIDPTPGEAAWFEGLRADYDFPLRFHGRDWLDAQIARMPEVERYFLRDGNAEVIQLLRELKDEVPDLGDATMALERMQRIERQLNDADPFYHYALHPGAAADGGLTPGTVLSRRSRAGRIDVVARYATAVDDRPISVNIRLVFDDEHTHLREQFENVLDAGGHVELPEQVVEDLHIDAPGGVGGNIGPSHLMMASTEETLNPPVPLRATILDGDLVVQQLSFQLSKRSGGRRSVTLTGQDSTGHIGISLTRDDSQQLKASLTFTPASVPPGAMLPAVRFLDAAQPGRTLRIEVLTQDGGTAVADITEPAVDSWAHDLIDALDRIQRHTGITFAVPEDLTREEIGDILQVGKWLAGERVPFNWDEITISMAGLPDDLAERVLSDEGGALAISEDAVFELREHRLPLGRLWTHLPAVRAEEATRLRRQVQGGQRDVEVTFRPADNNPGTRWLQLD